MDEEGEPEGERGGAEVEDGIAEHGPLSLEGL
jgi:hypothetical protein